MILAVKIAAGTGLQFDFIEEHQQQTAHHHVMQSTWIWSLCTRVFSRLFCTMVERYMRKLLAKKAEKSAY